MKFIKLRSAGHVTRMSLQNFVLENPWIAPLTRPQVTWQDHTEIDLDENDYEVAH